MTFSKTPALKCKCQNCLGIFQVNRYMVHTVNLDINEEATIDFLTGRLNEVQCPDCQSVFTYEIPMVIFSFTHRFAVRVNPAYYYTNKSMSQKAPVYLVPKDFRFREVTFQIEAIEKSRIFMDGLDDIAVEYIKLKYFTDEQTLPFDEINMLYDYQSNSEYYFKQLNCLNLPLGFYTTPKENTGNFLKRIVPGINDKWHIINRITILNYLTEE